MKKSKTKYNIHICSLAILKVQHITKYVIFACLLMQLPNAKLKEARFTKNRGFRLIFVFKQIQKIDHES